MMRMMRPRAVVAALIFELPEVACARRRPVRLCIMLTILGCVMRRRAAQRGAATKWPSAGHLGERAVEGHKYMLTMSLATRFTE